VAIGTVVEFMAFSDPDMLASMTKSTQFICLLSADWNGVRQDDRVGPFKSNSLAGFSKPFVSLRWKVASDQALVVAPLTRP
jgi:hypothetical protein